MREAFIVVGYNNIRLYDVLRMRDIAQRNFNADLVLAQESPNENDYKHLQHVVPATFSKPEQSAEEVLNSIRSIGFEPIGILPFSDKGVQLGAYLADLLKLPGAEKSRVQAACDKAEYRRLEQKNKLPKNLKSVKSGVAHTVEEIDQYAKIWDTHKLFLKPCGEGNSRGCIAVEDLCELHRAWSHVERYKDNGILVEELIENAVELSVDSVCKTQWITRKYTTSGLYRAEYQQLIGQWPEKVAIRNMLSEVGDWVSALCGGSGAYHNELFLLKDHSIRVVEPNMRPAGGFIWDLAAHAFDEFDPWNIWLSWACGDSPFQRDIKKRQSVVIRLIPASADGHINYLPDLPESSSIVELRWYRKINDYITKNPMDNSGFLGHVICVGTTDEAALYAAKESTDELLSNIQISGK